MMRISLLALFALVAQMCAGSAAEISKNEFNAAVQSAGYQRPADDVYKYFAETTRKFSRGELAMFLAQLMHESGGFRYKEEIVCTRGNRCAGRYVDRVGLPGKTYHGRGFIQLTWGANYKAASNALGMGDRLLRNPEIVAQDTRIAMLVSVWYWETRVRPAIRGRQDMFGLTTKAINPGECRKGNVIAKRRYTIYLKVANALKIQNKARENGCYN